MRRRLPRRARGPALAVTILLLVAFALLRAPRTTGLPDAGAITRVVDGDTLHVAAGGRDYAVRLIGVDTPEARPSDKLDRDVRRSKQDRATVMALGKRASAFTRALCDGKPCRLGYDPADAAQGYRDRYDRLLAYVWVDEGGREVLVNAEIVRAGYGKALTSFPMDEARKEEFLALQREARAQGRGLWGEWKP